MDTKRSGQVGSRFLFSGRISAATSVPISQRFTNQALSNESDVKLVRRERKDSDEEPRLWETRVGKENIC